MSDETDLQKRAVAEAAAELVRDGMRVGLGTGTTFAYVLPYLAELGRDAVYVATSRQTDEAARALGLTVEAFDALDRLDLALDGADQVDPACWLVKGGGAAHTREKIVAAAADRFVVLVSENKLVDAIRPPIPLELFAFGLEATLRHVGSVELRDAPPSPDGNVIADYLGGIGDPAALAERLSATPGVVEHGLFPPALVGEVLIGTTAGIETMRPS